MVSALAKLATIPRDYSGDKSQEIGSEVLLTLASLKVAQVCTCTTFKQIELESPGWSGFVKNSKPDQT